MTYQESLAKAAKLFEDAKAILVNPAATAEEKAKVDQMLADAKVLNTEALQLKDIEAFGAEIASEHEQKQGEDKEKAERKENRKFEDWAEFVRSAWLANHKDAGVRKIDPRLQYFKEQENKSGHQQKVLVE